MVAAKHKILCVDDDPYILETYRLLGGLERQPGEKFHIETATNGEQGLATLRDRGPYAVVLSDMRMPGMDGIHFLRQACQIAPATVRMMVTGATSMQLAIDAVNEGHIFRFLTKPFTLASLCNNLHAGVRQYQLQMAEKELLEQTVAGSLKLLTEILSLINPVAFGKAMRVRRWVQRLAAALKVEEAWQLEVAAMLSQMGCVTLPEDLLKKINLGLELLPDEQALFAAHPKIGHDLIAAIPRFEAVAEIIAAQEKCFDGTGFPADGKRGTDIPLGARILKIALDFDSQQSRGLDGSDALAKLRYHQERYDPAVLDALGYLVEADARVQMKELSLRDLMVLLQFAQQQETTLRGREFLDAMVLAEDVLSSSGVLMLSKGQKITPALLQRLRNFTRHSTIREPIKVWVPSHPGLDPVLSQTIAGSLPGLAAQPCTGIHPGQ